MGPIQLKGCDLVYCPTHSLEVALWVSSGFPSSLHFLGPAFRTPKSQFVPQAWGR